MSGDLIQALLLFGGSSALVVSSGYFLARYGDAIAGLMGWGRLWVGTILVAAATSLPELATNITAASRNQPELVGGDIFGSNMVNMLILAVVALVFGGARFFRVISPEQRFIGLVAMSLTGMAVLLSAYHMGVSFVGVGLASILILSLYLAGMRLVYVTRPRDADETGDAPPGAVLSLRRAWVLFGLASLGVLLAAPALVFSVEEIAEITGLETSFLGVVAVALVTSMPEVSTTFAAVRFGAIDLAVGNLYGSCAFNILILALADPFYRQGVLSESLEEAHIAAGLVAVLLMGAGLLQIFFKGSHRFVPVVPTLVAMALVYFGGVYAVYTLG